MNNELNRIIQNLAELKGKPLQDYRKLALSTLSRYEIAAINQAVRARQADAQRAHNYNTLSWD